MKKVDRQNLLVAQAKNSNKPKTSWKQLELFDISLYEVKASQS